MSFRDVLKQRVIAISVSESPDMEILGLTDEHLRDAMVEIARHLLAVGARLAYGGDLRPGGFTELLFELVARHGREDTSNVLDYLAWPAHISETPLNLARRVWDVKELAEIIFLSPDGKRWTIEERLKIPQVQPTDDQWAEGLTVMREVMGKETDARVILGGRTDVYRGVMPGIGEEALVALRLGKPLFVMGGFGGCARDVAEVLDFAPRSQIERPVWEGMEAFREFRGGDPRNGLSPQENRTLALTPHVDEAITLMLHGLLSLDRNGELGTNEPPN